MRKLTALMIAGVLLAGASGSVLAQGWPSRPVRIAIIVAPGGLPDLVARAVAAQLGPAIGQSVVVENRPGGGGNIATEFVAKATPDGHTLLVTGPNHAVNRTLIPNPGFDYERDLAPITMMAEANLLLVAHPGLPANGVAEMIALAKRKPGSLAFSTSVIGSPNHVGAELIALMSGAEFNVITYKGIAQAIQEVVSGESQLVIASIQAVLPMIRAGRLKPLAVTQPKRSRFVPEVPTLSESGLAGFDVNTWICLLATGGTPQAVVDRLNAEVKRIVASAEIRETLEKQTAEPWTTSPAETAAVIRAETAKWAGVLKNVKSQAR